MQRKRLEMSTKRILKTLAVMAVMLSVAALPAMAQSELVVSCTFHTRKDEKYVLT